MVRHVQGEIYRCKFDDLLGWTEEKSMTWFAVYSSTPLSGSQFFSSPYSLMAYVYSDAVGEMTIGEYLRRTRTITIPAGLTSVRMQVHHRWTSVSQDRYWEKLARRITLGSETFLDKKADEDARATWYLTNASVNTAAGSQSLKVGVHATETLGHDYGKWQETWFDDLVIARSGEILIKGLSADWEVRLYDASDVLIVGAHAVAGTVTLDVSTSMYPITGRFKVYNDADVLQHTSTLSTDIFGGDEYAYGSGAYPLTIATDYFVLNRTGMASPTQANIIFNLKDTLGDPVAGATVTFTTTHGTLGTASDTTDAAGNAHTTISADTAGCAIVEGVYEGDPDNGIVRVFNALEINIIGQGTVAVAVTGYDVWIHGTYIPKFLNVRLFSDEDRVEIELPDINSDVAYGHEIAVYQDAALIFTGRIELIKKALKPESVTVISGRSYLQHLRKIYVESATFTEETLKAIAEEIFTTYINPLKQVSLGTIAEGLANITVTIEETETTAFDLLMMVANSGGVSLSVDENRHMHLK